MLQILWENSSWNYLVPQVVYYIYNHPFQRAEHFEVDRNESDIVGSSMSLFNLHKSSTKQNTLSNSLITVTLTSEQVAA